MELSRNVNVCDADAMQKCFCDGETSVRERERDEERTRGELRQFVIVYVCVRVFVCVGTFSIR